MESTVRCLGLTKTYGAATALNNVSLDLPSGKIIGLLGPNGSGKSTFLKILAGVLQPTSGAVTICGMKPSPETKAIVSYLPDRPFFDNSMPVSDYISLFDDFYEDFDRSCAEGMIRDLGVNPNAKIRTLSKGMVEKVQLSLVMARRAKLYLLDEPIGGVDPASRDYLSSPHTSSTILKVSSTDMFSSAEEVSSEAEMPMKPGKTQAKHLTKCSGRYSDVIEALQI